MLLHIINPPFLPVPPPSPPALVVSCSLPPQNYFTRVLEDDLKAVIKPQYVDHIPKAVRGNVEEVLDSKDQRGIKQYLLDHLDLTQVGILHRHTVSTQSPHTMLAHTQL